MDIDTVKYSEELAKVIALMESEVLTQFPSYELTPYYLLYSIICTTKCDGYKALEELVVTYSINTIFKSVSDELNVYCSTKNVHILNPKKKVLFNDELKTILVYANNERDLLGDDEITTEHVLLSLLSNHNKIKPLFNCLGVDYNMYRNKIQSIRKNMDENGDDRGRQNNVMGLPEMVPVKISNENGVTLIEMKRPQVNRKPGKTVNIDAYTTNLNRLCENGKLDNVLGREEEVDTIIKTLMRRNRNNVILTGPSGCGLTSMVNLLAIRLVYGKIPLGLVNKEILRLNIDAMVAGTQFKGVFEQRAMDLLKEIKSVNKKYILFIDDLHMFLEQQNNNEVLSFITSILNDDDLQIICTIPVKYYKLSLQKNTSIEKRMYKIMIEPTSVAESIHILTQNKHYYEEYHKVIFPDNVISECVKLAERFISDKVLPSSAIELIDLIGSSANVNASNSEYVEELKNNIINCNQKIRELIINEDFEEAERYKHELNKYNVELKVISENRSVNNIFTEITNDDVLNTLSNIAKIPLQTLSNNELKNLSNINNVLKDKVIGQDEAIDKVCAVIKRNRVSLKSNVKKPDVFLFVGGTGTGKTYLCKQLARQIYGDEKYLIRMDMSEYSEKHTVQNIIGSPRSYVGFGEGTFLLESVKAKKRSVILLDEIEKACTEVFNVFLTLFDEGYLTDSTGEKVDFSNCIIIMTSNVGTKVASEHNKVGFTRNEEDLAKEKENVLKKEIKKKFPVEFINRINNIIYFNPLSKDNMKSIIKLILNELNDFLKERKDKMSISYDEKVVDYIYGKLTEEDSKYGARPILRIIEQEIENLLTDIIISGENKNNREFFIKITEDDSLLIT